MGRASSVTSDGLKKGAWNAEEDQKLISYVLKHGEGGWSSMPQKAGLQRCGRSCRLRWTNYLKPGIRRGDFTTEEDQSITSLQAQLGNRWAAIAKHFPGRTDHEIKNHWHAHLKKRLSKTNIHPTITSGSSYSGNSDDTTVIVADQNTDTECSKPQQSDPKRQRSTSALLLNKLATRITQCIGPPRAHQTLQPMPFNGNNIFCNPFSSCTAPETSDKDIVDPFTILESENDIIAFEFSSLSCVDELYEGLWDDDVIVNDDMIIHTVGSTGFYDSNLFS